MNLLSREGEPRAARRVRMLEARIEESHGALVVTPLVRRLDAEAAPHLREIVGPLASERSLVVVDLAHVASADCSGLASLVSLLRRMPPGGELRLAGARPPVRALLAATTLDEVFPLYEDAAAALRLREGGGAVLRPGAVAAALPT